MTLENVKNTTRFLTFPRDVEMEDWRVKVYTFLFQFTEEEKIDEITKAKRIPKRKISLLMFSEFK